MKSIANCLFLFAAAALSLGTAAYGQNTLKADVPFAFRGPAGTAETAGYYIVRVENNGSGYVTPRIRDLRHGPRCGQHHANRRWTNPQRPPPSLLVWFSGVRKGRVANSARSGPSREASAFRSNMSAILSMSPPLRSSPKETDPAPIRSQHCVGVTHPSRNERSSLSLRPLKFDLLRPGSDVAFTVSRLPVRRRI